MYHWPHPARLGGSLPWIGNSVEAPIAIDCEDPYGYAEREEVAMQTATNTLVPFAAARA
jgi:hypothetical protein